jgi:hypothetical protein
MAMAIAVVVRVPGGSPPVWESLSLAGMDDSKSHESKPYRSGDHFSRVLVGVAQTSENG